MNGRIELDAKRITRTLALLIGTFATAHLVLQLARFQLGYEHVYGLVRLFDMREEANLPAFFSSFQLVIVSLLLAAIGSARRHAHEPFALHWTFLALIFILLAADESAMIHEMSIDPIQKHAPWLATGLFYWAWVLPAAVLVVTVAFSYARFVFQYLPQATRNAALLGALLFVCGAMGMEMLEGRHSELYSNDDLTYALYVLVEESLEMSGILVFLAGLLKYFSRQLGTPVLAVRYPR